MVSAIASLERGLRMVFQPGCRRYVFAPLVINLLIYVLAIWWMVGRFEGWIAYWMMQVPSWLSWLEWLIWPLVVLSLLVIAFFSFTLVATLIASPFYGFLAEKLDAQVSGVPVEDDRSLAKQALDSLGRECRKLGYFLPRMLILVIIGFIPGVNILSPLLWALFSAWSMAIQYLDYPMDLHRVSFNDMKARLRKKWWQSLTFGGVVALGMLIPLLNLLIMPAAVAASVTFWHGHYRRLGVTK
ncbi:sulfate transporter CysZ [Larsenimonas rhizosphaerae]|uniref:Sulfate transporter CysZ n=1 Tax=Larsenimonas rhizosphaerae TaxID=2944682 RepID=A0AA42CW11_9GAMM|nr:sulfate transporter CysZ [Larsenimonas rhizosphaerae]MCM2131200.1 sulfate transporter CysZ [Larsenimonas rhizosphaerae]MCX2525441.1 sulfate transporter CysZ [Larsenimonas rhizosphaerae]